MQQAEDYRQEARSLAVILEPLCEEGFDAVTQFKGWRINDVLGHLLMFDVGALETLKGGAQFQAFFAPIQAALKAGRTLLDAQQPWLDGLAGRALFERWRETSETLADAYSVADPKQRVQWAGPEMSALSSITARQMETWAHGQEIFDLLGQTRLEQDRIRNIAHLGVATYGWSFANRGLSAPEPAPQVRLTAPSGAVWEWNTAQSGNAVLGDAVDFARVVTQVRALADTALELRGDTARRWMQIAQCFAGPPQTPPLKGERHPQNLKERTSHETGQ